MLKAVDFLVDTVRYGDDCALKDSCFAEAVNFATKEEFCGGDERLEFI